MACRKHAAALGCTLVALAAVDGWAAEGGYSNYVPGTYGDFGMALAPAERWTLRQDFYYYGADAERSVRSGDLVVGIDLEFIQSFTTLLFKPDVQILGAQFAAGVFVPLVHFELDGSVSTGGMEVKASDEATGLGDLTFIPIVLYWNRDRIHTSFAQYVIAPTGDYSTDNLINDSLNYWSFDTNFALTYLNPETGRDVSFNIGHIYNTENDDTDYQTGRELHLDVVFNQFLSESLAIGAQGYYYKQLSGDSGSGALLGDFKAESAGAGPALLWATRIGGQDVSFIAKWMHEFHAENRLEGDHFFVSFAFDW